MDTNWKGRCMNCGSTKKEHRNGKCRGKGGTKWEPWTEATYAAAVEVGEKTARSLSGADPTGLGGDRSTGGVL